MGYMCKHANKECDACGSCIKEPQYILCDICDTKIYIDDEYYEVDGVIYCEDCMDRHRKCYEGD